MIKTVKIKGTDNERIHNSELNEYSFSKTLVKHKSKIIEFLEDKYLEVFDKAHAIDSIDRKMIAKDYLISNSQLKYNEEFLNECEMFIDLFLVENYKKLHYKKALGKHTNTETKVLKPNFKTNVKERKKENMEREKLKCQMGEFTSKEKLQLANTIKTIDANCGYSKYKDAIVDEIEVFINEKNTKLKVLLPWTSAGKSHAVKQTIYNHFSNTGFKIIITTPNKCNLPSISEIVRALQDKGITVNASDIIMIVKLFFTAIPPLYDEQINLYLFNIIA